MRFWNDPDGERYRASYFDHSPGVWRHGDWATLTDDGAARHPRPLGLDAQPPGRAHRHRRDLRGGRRLPEVADSLVIGVEQPDGGYWMPLFVVLERRRGPRRRSCGPGSSSAIRTAASPRHVPDEIVAGPRHPPDPTGKKLEVPIKRLFMGADPDTTLNRGAVSDPAALDAFVALAGERGSRGREAGSGQNVP